VSAGFRTTLSLALKSLDDLLSRSDGPVVASRGEVQRIRSDMERLQREAADDERALQETADEAEGMRRLQEMSTRLLSVSGMQPLLEEVLDAIIALHGADFGLVQQIDRASGDLLIVAQRNSPVGFLAYLAGTHDDGSDCGRAMLKGERVIVEDVTTDPGFTRHRAIAAATGFRTIQSTPLISRQGEFLGVISTCFSEPHRFSVRVLRFTDLYARQAAEIVERSAAEEALRSSEERFRRYFDLGLIGMALTSTSKGLIEVNDELCRIFGYPRDELLRMTWAELTHPDDLAADGVQYDRVMAGEQDGYTLTKRFIHKDGRAIYTTMAANCLRAADGSVDFFVGLVQDISDRLEAEDELRRARDQLARVARATTLGELAVSIAHEINQPLAAVVVNGNACTRWLAAEPPNLSEAVEAVGRIVSDANRAAEIIKGIRRFLQRGQEEFSALDLAAMVSEVVAMIQGQIREKGVSLRVAVAEGLPPVLGDRVQLQQVVVNLAMNAIEAMTSVMERERVLEIRLDRHDAHTLRVSLRDTGVGLTSGQRDRVFDAFHTTKPSGMGMGLPISRTIVEAHGGRLWATSNPDHGETFQFTLALTAQ
jgi:PAS domain S-box-containing protein